MPQDGDPDPEREPVVDPAFNAMVDKSGAHRFEWISRRNCSLAPSRLAVLISIPALVSLSISAWFAFMGTWWMMFFATIEALALVCAFVVYARHAGAYERIELTSQRLLVEFHSGSRTFREELHPDWTQIVFPCAKITGFRQAPLVEVREAGRTLCLGRFVSPAQRVALVGELRGELRRAVLRRSNPQGATPQRSNLQMRQMQGVPAWQGNSNRGSEWDRGSR